jgi:hypothetical protein
VTEKNEALVLLGATAVLGGILEQSFDPLHRSSGYWMAGTTLLPLFFGFRWYVLDAAERGFRRTRLFDILLVGAGLLVMPWYLLRTRGARSGFRAIGLLLLGFVALSAVNYAAMYAVYRVQLSLATGDA